MLNKVKLLLNNQSALCYIHIINQALSMHRISAYYTGLELPRRKAVPILSTGKIQQIKEKVLSFLRVADF